MSKQLIVTVLSLVGLLSACASPTNLSSQNVATKADCPTESTLPIETFKKPGYYENFKHQIRNIVSVGNIIKFQTSNYDFVFCRGNNKWAVQSGTLPDELQPQKDAATYQKELANPRFKTIDFNGKSYQYRVILEPNPFPQKQLAEGEKRSEPQKVVFELISPNSKQPQRQTLYTLAQLRQEKIGDKLGVPRITAALKHDNQLFWTVSSEQGEGFSGIGTIVSYNPQKNSSIIIQPEQVKRQQITDLVITGSTNPTFWMGTKISGEGNPDLPGMGLVTYRPEVANLKSGAVKFYDVNNSPIVGAIPEKLKLDNEQLWVGTGNGICKLKWQTPDDAKSWNCQRFAVLTQLPKTGIPLYNSVRSKNVAATLSPDKSGEMQEVLWFAPLDTQTNKGRYEVRYPQGFTATLNEQGANFFSKEVEQIRAKIQPGKPQFYWLGSEWHWNGFRFVRGLDEVALNSFGGGPRGIADNRANSNRILNSNAIRGDFDLLSLSEKSTSVKYYSGWIDDANIKLYLTTLPQERPDVAQPNPLEAIVQRLRR